MKTVKFSYCPAVSGVALQEVEAIGKKLLPEIERIQQARAQGYKTEYASINVSFDQPMHEHVKHVVEKRWAQLNPTVLVVIGVGGSSLGVVALHEAINGFFYNESAQVRLYFVDTIDADYTSLVVRKVKEELKKGNNVLINVITKSGTTTETIANFGLFLEIVQEYRFDTYTDYFIITTDRDSKLWNYAQQKKIETLEVPKSVGGRYSVFSPVGIFPLFLVGIDVDQLLNGARTAVQDCLNTDIMRNPAAISAAVVYAQLHKGCSMHDTFIFSRQLRAIGDWYRQLVAESLGKRSDRSGVVVHAGITPTTSIGPNDLHSVTQLHLAGPRDKFTTFVTVQEHNQELSVPDYHDLEKLVENINGKSIAHIMNAVAGGVQKAYQSQDLPFISLELPEKSAFYLGQFLQMKMIEVMLLGYLMDVNPFNQPQVELYKQETRTLLASQ